MRRRVCAFALMLVATAATAVAGSITATVTLGGATPRPAASAFVWMNGASSVAASSPQADPVSVIWGASGPTPATIAVAVGGRVSITNASKVAHALFSRSAAATFDHDLAEPGDAYELVAAKAGIIVVFCDDHASEELRVLVADGGPIYRADASGKVVIADLPSGAYTLAGWHEAGEIATKPVTVGSADTISVALELPASRRRSTHNNASGNPYLPAPGTLEVVVMRTEAGGAKVPAVDAVVWLAGSPPPRVPGVRSAAAPAPAVTARSKRFTPRVVAVATGASVAFPNQDRIYHNVFSLSETKGFDLGLYKSGKSKSVEFDRPGVVKVFCNIHPKMAGYVVITDGGSNGVTAADGRVKLTGIAPGSWKLEAWDERGGSANREVTVEPGKTSRVEISLDASGFRETSHKNKFGEDYPPPDDEESRY